jgi:rhomboid protease GluP
MANCTQCGRKLPPLTFGKKVCQWCVRHEAAQRGENDEDAKQHVMPAPWVRREASITLTHVLFGANVAVFLAMVLASGSVMDFSGRVVVSFGANYGPYTLSGEWWRLLTYMFLHGSLMHIAFNMWCLWDLGALSESLYGRWTYLSIYLITGVSAGLTSAGWHPLVPSVGASGAIFGLAGALIASFYLGEFSLPGIAIRGTLRSLVVFVVFNVFFGSLFPGIDNACHAGGLVSGLILGGLIARLAPEHDRPLRRAGVLLFMALLVAGSALAVQRWRGAPFRTEWFSVSQNRPARGVSQLQAAVQRHPGSVEAHLALARAYFDQEDLPHAETEFKRVLELDPQYARARVELGMVYLIENRSEDARLAFAHVVTQNANDASAHYGLGLVFSQQEKHQEAIAEFKIALRLGASFKGIYYVIGQNYAMLKSYDEAITAFLSEREKNGDDADLETALAQAYQAKGMAQQAQEARNKAAHLKNTQ